MKKIALSVALLTTFGTSVAFAHCNDFVGTWVGLTTHQDPLHILTCRYKTHATITPGGTNTPSQVTLNYSLDSGIVKKICKKSLPKAIYTIQCREESQDVIVLHRKEGKALTMPPHFGGMIQNGQMHVMGKLSGSKVNMVLKKVVENPTPKK